MRILVAFLLAASAALTGCASFDRGSLSSIEPIKTEGGYRYFRFKAKAGAAFGYPLEEVAAERKRMAWLEEWLSNTGYPTPVYEIVSREPIKLGTGLWGPAYEVFYTVRLKGSVSHP
jgi:hypothetical protein